MPNMNTRNTSELAKFDELLDRKIGHLASKDDINEIKALFTSMKEKLMSQDKKITALEFAASTQEKRIINLESKVEELSSCISKLQDKNAVLNNSVDFLTKRNDHQEQYSRRYCLRFNGIAKESNESSQDCVDKVVSVCKDLNINITSKDIDRAHRVGKDRKTLIVKFYSFGLRTSVYKARKKAKQNVKIHLDLTKQRLDLLDEASKLVKNDCNVDFVFADINCNVVARLKTNQYMFFDNIESFKSKILTR